MSEIVFVQNQFNWGKNTYVSPLFYEALLSLLYIAATQSKYLKYRTSVRYKWWEEALV